MILSAQLRCTPFFRDKRARHQRFYNPRAAAVHKLAEFYPENSKTLEILKDRAENDPDWMVRYFAIEELSKIWKDAAEKFEFLCGRAFKDPFERDVSFNEDNPRKAAMESLLTHYLTHPKTIKLLSDRAINDPDDNLREWAQEQLKKIESGE